ncbi:putative cysteine desulfurase family protein [Eubacterium sp. CAG:603]|mgnify:FL=1|jgi:Selenocysteine lyase|nr:putative cysteine desulfurase family protein [Eubacterium sp. CAG:603]
MIYLDNAATTYPKPEEVYEIMDRTNRNCAFNTGRGSYKAARKLNELLENTRDKIVNLVYGDCHNVVFTPSVTIALNQIINGLEAVNSKNDAVVYVSPYEHNAVARTLALLKSKRESIKSGLIIRELPINPETLEIDLDKVKYDFAMEPPALICCNHISNVTGYILPVQSIFEYGKEYNSINILDASQSLGLVKIIEDRANSHFINADFIAFAGHKSLYGPFGAAGFITNNKYELAPYIAGGTGSDSLNLHMPEEITVGQEPGSHNIVAIAGLSAALDNIEHNMIEDVYKYEKKLTDNLIDGLKKNRNIKLYLPANMHNHIAIVSFNVKGYKADEVGKILDEDFDIAVRTGYHCAPYIHKWLHSEEYAGTVRASIGRYTTEEDIESLIDALEEL